MKTEIQPLGDANLAELAKVNYEARHDSVLSDRAPSVPRIEKALRDVVTRDSNNIAIQARDDSSGALRGWLNLYTGIPGMVFAGRWYPVVLQGKEQRLTARRLIQEAESYTRGIGRGRLEIQFDGITPKHRPLLRKYEKWYSSEGFLKASEEFYMRAKLAETALEDHEIPQGFTLHPLTTVGNEEIRDCFLRAFRDSKDRLFVSMRAEEQETTFETCFKRSESVLEEDSYCIRKEGQVVAFVLVEKDGDKYLVEWLGVHPEYRRIGLGGASLAQSLRALSRRGVDSVGIETDVKNTPAIGLYKRIGFVPVTRQAYYYLNL